MVSAPTLLCLLLASAIATTTTTTTARLVPGQAALDYFHARASQRAPVFSDPTCAAIQAALSNASAIFPPGTAPYTQQIKHWCSSSDLYARCSVEPATAHDVAAIIKILGQSNSSFAVRGGGHSCAPGISASRGVNIAMTRFNTVSYNAQTQVAKYGAGLDWDDVYAGLEQYDRKVVGGRVSGVGAAGFSLGGGLSFMSGEYGTTSDNIVAYDFVTATGKILYVTKQTYPDLFFLLQGGFNNAGIVTNFYARAYPRARVWGGLTFVDHKYLDKVLNITAAFASTKNTDVKSGLLPTLNAFAGIPALEVQLFYNDPAGPPPGSYVKELFDELLAIPPVYANVRANRTMANFTQAAPSQAFFGMRGTFSTVNLERLTPEILEVIKSEFKFYGAIAPLGAGAFISYDLEPFPPAKSYPPAESSAWPHHVPYSPLNLYFAWPLGLSDATFYKWIRASTDKIRQAALAQGQRLEERYQYPNYVLYDSPLEIMYGPNLPRLTRIAAKYDPGKVMTRAGGFLFQKGPNTYGLSGPRQ